MFTLKWVLIGGTPFVSASWEAPLQEESGDDDQLDRMLASARESARLLEEIKQAGIDANLLADQEDLLAEIQLLILPLLLPHQILSKNLAQRVQASLVKVELFLLRETRGPLQLLEEAL